MKKTKNKEKLMITLDKPDILSATMADEGVGAIAGVHL